jgi:formate hydrogenlyase subunit 3/multisubunit Na+/H+ antiporter MnhD subunit
MKEKIVKEKMSKSTRLIYLIILFWVYFGVMGITYSADLTQLAGYYASLTLFVSTFLWGEYKRQSSKTSMFEKGESSEREITIYAVVFLWLVLGTVGIIFKTNINQLTVFFAALTPFVSSYIIYKTSKGEDIQAIDKETKKLVDISNIKKDETVNTTVDVTDNIVEVQSEDVKNMEVG